MKNKTFAISVFVLAQFIFSCKLPEKVVQTYLGDKDGFYQWNQNSENEFSVSYYLIVGSYKTLSEAEEIKNQLSVKGYPAIILPKTKGYFRISLGTYAYKKNVELVREQYIKDNPGVKPWIYSH